MLKKAGTIVAVAAAGVVALTPFAFANDDPEVDISSVEAGNQDVECDFENSQNVTGAGGLAGIAVGLPINATVPVLSCNNLNVEDVLDVDTANTEAVVAD